MVTVISALDGLRVCVTKTRNMRSDKDEPYKHIHMSMWSHGVMFLPLKQENTKKRILHGDRDQCFGWPTRVWN